MKMILHRTFSPARRIISCGFHLPYSTATVDDGDTSGFGFTADELSNSKPFSEIPSPKSYPFVGNMLAFKPFGDLEPFDRYPCCVKLHKRYGDVVRLSLPLIPILKNSLEVLDPDDFEIIYRNEGRYPSRSIDPVLIKYRNDRNQGLGLFLSNHEEWWKFRQPLNKGMMKANAATPYLDVQDPVGEELVGNLKKTLSRSSDNLHTMFMDDMFKYALESICTIVFDRRLGCMDPDLKSDSWQKKFINSVHGAFEALFSLNLNPKYRLYDKIGYRNKTQRLFEENMDYVTDTSLRLVQESKEDWVNTTEADLRKKFLPQLLNIETITMDEKVSVIFDMLLAAIDTTTYTTLSNCFFLAKNPEVQENLFVEINKNINKGDPLTSSTFSKLHYLRACIKESHRMKPIVPTNSRELLRDIVIKGYRIPKGTMVFIEHEYVSRCSKYVKDPEVFDPERWIRSKVKEGEKTHPFLVLPFGFGPRMCIGKRFAEQELNIALIKLIQNFRIEFDGDTLPLRGIGIDKLPVKLNFRFHER